MKKLALAIPIIFLFFSGCGPSKVKVSGKVVWKDGKPATELANGQIIFDCKETLTSARGVIQADGTFQINTEGPKDGVMPGLYSIAIVEHRPATEGSTRLPAQHLPDKYYSFDTSGLTFTVAPGINETTFTLERFSGNR